VIQWAREDIPALATPTAATAPIPHRIEFVDETADADDLYADDYDDGGDLED
jgi:hypothetical protein